MKPYIAGGILAAGVLVGFLAGAYLYDAPDEVTISSDDIESPSVISGDNSRKAYTEIIHSLRLEENNQVVFNSNAYTYSHVTKAAKKFLETGEKPAVEVNQSSGFLRKDFSCKNVENPSIQAVASKDVWGRVRYTLHYADGSELTVDYSPYQEARGEVLAHCEASTNIPAARSDDITGKPVATARFEP